MDENREKFGIEESGETTPWLTSRWLLIFAVVALAAAGIALGYGFHQQSLVGQLSSHEEQMGTTIAELRGQVDTLTTKLNDITAAQQAAAAAQNGAGPAGAKNASGKRGPGADKRLKQLQTRLDDQQKQLKDTQDEVAKTRTDLEGSLSSTRDELNGSIARTHEDLVVLQKRGERNFFEFDLVRSKEFQRFGPLMLSLRRTDWKHKNYDLALVVDDNQLSKKHVNLYEPVWIHRVDDPQPVQIVINKIERNVVHGYVSAPKYRNSDLAATMTPVSSTTTTPPPAQPDTPVAPSNPPNLEPPLL